MGGRGSGCTEGWVGTLGGGGAGKWGFSNGNGRLDGVIVGVGELWLNGGGEKKARKNNLNAIP